MGWQPYCNTIVTKADCWLGRQCHDTKICIVTEGLGLAGFWLQYKILYCDSGLGRRWARRARAGAQAALAWGVGVLGSVQQARGHGRDERGACGRHAGLLERAGRAGGRRAGLLGARLVARSARGRAGWAAWARGLAKGCALGALGLFLARFDSVFFLSQIFGHCS